MNDTVEQLKQQLASLGDEPSTGKVDVLNLLAWETTFSDADRKGEFASQALKIAGQLSYPKGIAWGLLNLGTRDYFVGAFDVALSKGLESLALFRELGDEEGIGSALLGIGMVYWSIGQFDRAVESLHQSIDKLHRLGIKVREGWALTSLGGVYESVGDLEKALECQTGCLELFRGIDHRFGEGRALTGLGSILQRQGKLDEALKYHSMSLELSGGGENELGEARALNDIGTLYQAKGDLVKAEDSLSQALRIRRKVGNWPAEITTLIDLGNLSVQKHELDEALSYLHRALELALKAKTQPKIYRAHEALSHTYEARGDFRKALEHHRAFQQVKEEVLGEQSNTRLKNLQIKFEAEALERLKSAQARLIQLEKMASLGKLVAGLAHEINSPVGVISSSTDVARRALAKLDGELAATASIEALKKSSRWQAALEALRQHRVEVEQAGERLGTIVQSLKNFTHLDEAEFQLTDVRQGIESTLALLSPQWGDRIKVIKKFADVPKIESFPVELNQAFMTLFLNAAEAIEGEGVITIATSTENGHVRVMTSDTGHGIPEDRLAKIFEVGFIEKGSKIRLHVGLANVQAVVQKHRGEIKVRSELEKGTTFEILLPVRQG